MKYNKYCLKMGNVSNKISTQYLNIRNQNKNEIARGLVAYSAKDTLMIKGRRSMEIEDILGYQGRDELIHRDDLVLV